MLKPSANKTPKFRPLVGALALVLAGCANADNDQAAPVITTIAPSITTTTAADGTTTTSSSTTTPPPGGELVRCTNPAGFSIAAPRSWEVNEGTVVNPCSRFNPEPFELQAGTDLRTAAITAYVDPIPFEQTASQRRSGENVDRRELTVDGRQAVRVSYVSGQGEFYRPGTPVTRYAVNLAEGGHDRTLFLSTVGLPGWNYSENVAILDRMVSTIRLNP